MNFAPCASAFTEEEMINGTVRADTIAARLSLVPRISTGANGDSRQYLYIRQEFSLCREERPGKTLLYERYKIKYVCLKPINYDLVKLVAGCLVFYGEVTVQVV